MNEMYFNLSQIWLNKAMDPENTHTITAETVHSSQNHVISSQ